MPTIRLRSFHAPALAGFLLATLAAPAFAQTATITAPPEVTVGAHFPVAWTGPGADGDFISIDKVGAPERQYGTYKYVKEGNPLTMVAPGQAGTWLIRYRESGSPYPVLGQIELTVKGSTATFEMPSSAEVGTTLTVHWTGPGNPRDFISIDPGDASERTYGKYAYTKEGSPIELPVPGVAGAYKVRYHLGVSGYPVIGSAPLEVKSVSASLEFDAAVAAGNILDIHWQGPANPKDFISIDPAGAVDRTYGKYRYVKEGNPVQIAVPDEPGTYLVRYHLHSSGYPVIASREVRVGDVTATVSVAGPVVAGEPFEVEWTGPDNPLDFITIVAEGTKERIYGRYAYTRRGSPLRVLAPEEAGPHEVRYLTGQVYKTLASVPVEVVPGTAKGSLRVFLSQASDSGASTAAIDAVEVILDASGSMLQRLDGTRRIELARQALLDLTGSHLPDGVPFALRVFGHREADSCRTDLEIPLAPLDRTRAASTLTAVNAKNLAKTPIADSLRQVKDDLSGASGSRLVILVTDGEETCGGDPAAVIEELKATGFDVRVNIVGFAIDELMVKEEFERWARLGGGRYFDAADGESLRGAVRGALATTYEVVQSGAVVASGSLGGDAIELDPGDYTVRVAGRDVGAVTGVAKDETRLVVED
ncbi:MAG: VWA domain-containing protein [Acidobacteriota bacterium]